MYSYTTGGPFGLEEMVTTSGPGMTLLYLLFLPFVWSIPVSLVSAELTTAMPVDGGFYRWTRAAFGDFFGFLAGWWNWSASFLLGGAYAVLFTDYLAFYIPQLTGWKHYAVSVAIIALIGWLNVLGIDMVGKAATAMEIFVFLPIIVMTTIGLAKFHHNPFLPLVPPQQPFSKVFGVGLALGLWLYAGYEQVSSVAEEVENPKRNYPLALAIVVPLSMATYFLPTFAGLGALNNWQAWRTGSFPSVASLLGGAWLGSWMTLAAMLCDVALLNSTVLTSTRMPFAMAQDGYLPEFFARKHPRYGTPATAIVVSSLIYAALAFHTLGQLISIYLWLRAATTVLTVLSAWGMRRRHPDLARPFRIPGGNIGLLVVVLLPIAMTYIALRYSDPIAQKWGPVALLAGVGVYGLVRFRRPPIHGDPKRLQ